MTTGESPSQELLDYFGGNDLAASTWLNKYATDGDKTPDNMHKRMAKELYKIEEKYENPLSFDIIYELLKEFKYLIPGGSIMSNLGNRDKFSSLSNCFVIGNSYDSYSSILRTDEEQVHLMKRRGGVGHDLSHLRPKGMKVSNSSETSTGAASFMERYSNTTREVAQNGRRGALMLTMSVEHPDVEDFIDAKMDTTKVTGANISVKITNKFMNAAIENKPFEQKFPIMSENPTIKRDIDASKLWNKIITNAWRSAEPGVLFWDTILNKSPADCYTDAGFKTISTNPCAEVPLCSYDTCRLMSLNLYSYVNFPYTKNARFDHTLFCNHVTIAQRLMDDVIDCELEMISLIQEKINEDTEPQHFKDVEAHLWDKIKQKTIRGRRTGLGVTGLGDMIASLGFKYASKECSCICDTIFTHLFFFSLESSIILAKERGSFPVFNLEKEKDNKLIKFMYTRNSELKKDYEKYGRRNIATLAIAPTGTISLMTQTTSGIEPEFMVSYKRRVKVTNDNENVTFIDEVGDKWREFNVFSPGFKRWLIANKLDPIKIERLSDKDFIKVVEQSPYYGSTAYDICWTDKIKLQGFIQKWIDHSISCTVNIPENTTIEIVKEIYETAWKTGCKGCTIYRDKCRTGVLVSRTEEVKQSTKRPKELDAKIIRFKNEKEEWIAVIGLLDDNPYEIFTGKAEDLKISKITMDAKIIRFSKPEERECGSHIYNLVFRSPSPSASSCTQEIWYTIGISRAFDKEYWNYAKLISGVMRQGMDIVKIIELVEGLNTDSEGIHAWKNGVARALRAFIPNKTKCRNKKCDTCKGCDIVYSEGCVLCLGCGNSLCG